METGNRNRRQGDEAGRRWKREERMGSERNDTARKEKWTEEETGEGKVGDRVETKTKKRKERGITAGHGRLRKGQETERRAGGREPGK